MDPSLAKFIAFSALWISILVMCGYYGYYCSTWRNTFEQKLKKEGYCSWSFLNICWKFLNVLNKPTLTCLDWWSDILVIVAMTSVNEELEDLAGRRRTIFWPFVMSITVLVIHAVISAIYVFYDSGRNLKRAGLQLFNMLIFEHVYNSMINGHPVYELQETRVLETIFESAPQAVIQVYFVLLLDDKSEPAEIWFSLILTIISLTSAVRSLDAYGLKSGIGFQWHALLFITRSIEITLKVFLIVLMAALTSATYTVVYVTLSSLFVALITFHFRSREFGQHEASVFIREVCISGINAYLLRPGLEANVFLFTNIFKILESVVFIVVIHMTQILYQYEIIAISVSYIVIVVSYIAIYCADIYDHDKYRNARDEDLNSLFESKHFELIMKLIRKNKLKLKDLSLDQLIYLRENGAPLSMFECSDIEVYNLYAVGYDFSEYNTEDLESTKGFSKTALIWASQKGHSSMIRNLIDAGVNLEAKDETGSTALICASENGHDSTVQMLIDAGADVKAKTDDRSTALFCARKNGHESIMKMLIDAEADVKESGKDGNTFLIGVSEIGGAEIDDVKAESDDRNLMGAGADSNANNKCMHMSTYVDFPRQRCSTDQEPSHENSLENPVNLNLTPELEAEWKASNSGGDDLDLQPESTMESIYIGNPKPVVAPKPHKDPARVDLPMHNSPILEPIPPMEPSTHCSSIGEAAKAQDRYGNNSA